MRRKLRDNYRLHAESKLYQHIEAALRSSNQPDECWTAELSLRRSQYVHGLCRHGKLECNTATRVCAMHDMLKSKDKHNYDALRP